MEVQWSTTGTVFGFDELQTVVSLNQEDILSLVFLASLLTAIAWVYFVCVGYIYTWCLSLPWMLLVLLSLVPRPPDFWWSRHTSAKKWGFLAAKYLTLQQLFVLGSALCIASRPTLSDHLISSWIVGALINCRSGLKKVLTRSFGFVAFYYFFLGISDRASNYADKVEKATEDPMILRENVRWNKTQSF